MPKWWNGRHAAFRAQCSQGRVGSNPTFGTRRKHGLGARIEQLRRVLVPAVRALVAQWIERSPAEAEAVGSNPAERAIL